jgi:hypothetical protein
MIENAGQRWERRHAKDTLTLWSRRPVCTSSVGLSRMVSRCLYCVQVRVGPQLECETARVSTAVGQKPTRSKSNSKGDVLCHVDKEQNDGYPSTEPQDVFHLDLGRLAAALTRCLSTARSGIQTDVKDSRNDDGKDGDGQKRYI